MILNTPILIHNLEIANRIELPPMATNHGMNGEVTEYQINYYREKSLGGCAGLIVAEHTYVSPEGIAGKNQLSISKDEDIEGFRKISDTVHANGTRIFLQISHAGGAADTNASELPALAPSPVTFSFVKNTPTEITRKDIARIIQCFADAAVRAKKSGFDGVEIHAAHAYLLNEFFSPIANKRTDEYNGQTLEGRTRLTLEVIRAVRAAVGPDYPVALRFGGCDYQEGGATIEDAVQAAQLYEKAGVDLLDVSGGMNGYMIKGRTKPGYFKDLTSAIRKKVSIPVTLTGGVKTGKDAEALLQEGAADLIGVGRAMLRDSKWADKVLKGEI